MNDAGFELTPLFCHIVYKAKERFPCCQQEKSSPDVKPVSGWLLEMPAAVEGAIKPFLLQK